MKHMLFSNICLCIYYSGEEDNVLNKDLFYAQSQELVTHVNFFLTHKICGLLMKISVIRFIIKAVIIMTMRPLYADSRARAVPELSTTSVALVPVTVHDTLGTR